MAEVPRSSFDQDLLYSFGAFMTACWMARNHAEARVRAMAKVGCKALRAGAAAPTPGQKGKPLPHDQPPVIEEHGARAARRYRASPPQRLTSDSIATLELDG
ncbi:MAG: hypothetical protein ACYC0T_20470 [Ramlibacter sp.]